MYGNWLANAAVVSATILAGFEGCAEPSGRARPSIPRSRCRRSRSIGIIKKLMNERMYPTTLNGLGRQCLYRQDQQGDRQREIELGERADKLPASRGGVGGESAGALPAGLSSPDHGVVCNDQQGACFDRYGPSMGLTEAFLGPRMAQALTVLLRGAPPDRRPGAEFSPAENVTCMRETGPCRTAESLTKP